jgi:hypothetical protein
MYRPTTVGALRRGSDGLKNAREETEQQNWKLHFVVVEENASEKKSDWLILKKKCLPFL